MKKTIILLAWLVSGSIHAQFVIDSHFKARSFEDYVAPLLIYQQAYNQAVNQFNGYFSNAQIAIEKGNFELAKTYLNGCVQLNYRLNICSPKDLSQWIDYCNEQIKYKEAIENFNDYLKKAMEFIDNDNYSMGIYYLELCQNLNERFNGSICSRNDLSQSINYCEKQIAFQKQRLNTNINSTNIINGAQYQTVEDNESCRITIATATNKYTIIEFDFTNLYEEGGWCNISPTTYIIDKTTGKKLQLLWAEGIPKSPKKHYFQDLYDTIHFKLVFPAISAKTSIIDMIESNDSCWKFYNIKIR